MFADDDALADAAFDRGGAEDGGVEVAVAFVHDDGAVGEVGAHADPVVIGDTEALGTT